MEGRFAATEPMHRQRVLELLPNDWSLDDDPVFDLDRAIETGQRPFPAADSSCRLVWAASGFTRIDDAWAEWLVEAGRILAEDGIALIGLAEKERFERLTGEAWDESPIGMTVLDAMNEVPETHVFHSEWWLKAHWGRAFLEVEVVERDGLRHAQLRRPIGGITAELLERPGEDKERELAAASANVSYLRSQLDLLAKRHRHQLAEQREEMGRELMRRSFAAADLEWARRGPGSPATLAAAEYEASTSWRITRPLRALGAMVRRLR